MAQKKPGGRRPDLPEVQAFRYQLKAILARRDMSQAALSQASELAEPIVARILSGERKPDINTLIRLARGLGMTLDDLLGLERLGKPGSEPTITRVIARKNRRV